MSAYNIDGILNAEKNYYIIPNAKGDGVTDDSTVFQNAINSGSPLVCETGKIYEISTPLRLKQNTVIDLNGSTLINRGNNVNSRIMFNFESDSTFTEYNGNGNITIKNGTIIEGGICFAHGENILIENVTFKNSRGSHFLEIASCKNYTIRNCSFVGMFSNVVSVKEYINIDICNKNAFPYVTPNDSPFYDGYKNSELTINNCFFSTGDDSNYINGYNAIGVHYSVENEYINSDIVIKNSQFIGFENCAIRLNDMENVYIANNNISTLNDGVVVGDLYNVDGVVIAFNYFNVPNDAIKTDSGHYSDLTSDYNLMHSTITP